ncbi:MULTISPECIES: hypothetical protein [unclassified Anabaena]
MAIACLEKINKGKLLLLFKAHAETQRRKEGFYNKFPGDRSYSGVK